MGNNNYKFQFNISLSNQVNKALIKVLESHVIEKDIQLETIERVKETKKLIYGPKRSKYK